MLFKILIIICIFIIKFRFTDNIKSVILYYPLLAKYAENNILQQQIEYSFNTNLDYGVLYPLGTDLYQDDFDKLYHWSSENNFDYGYKYPGTFVYFLDTENAELSKGKCAAPCKRCYGTDNGKCYKASTNYVMNEQYARLTNGYYLKVLPTDTTIDKIKLNLNQAVINSKGKTLTFWVKVWGVLKTSYDDCPLIMNISNYSSSFLCYDDTNKIFYFIVNGAYKVFQDTTFFNNIGKWTFISVANYNALLTYKYYPSMTNVFIFNADMQRQETTISPIGISFEVIEFPTTIAALYADLRIYDTYIVQPLGIVNGNTEIRNLNLIQSFALSHPTDSTKCILDSDLIGQSVSGLGITCSGDYNEYFDAKNKCENKYYMNKVNIAKPVCKSK